MKNILYIFTLATIHFINSTHAQSINWLSLDQVVKLQKKEPRKVIMDVYTNWCGPCKMLDKNTFGNADVAKYINENYYAIKFNGEGNETISFMDKTYENPNYDPAKKNKRNSAHEFTRFLGVRAYPTMVFFDEDFNLIAPISGYLRPKQIEIYLKLFESENHKNINTKEDWDKYQKEFVNEFEG